jgi:hypothetical protein
VARAGARPDDWKVTPMPEARRDVPSGRVFTAEEMTRLREGWLPEEMEDKWLARRSSRRRSGASGWRG